MHPYKHDTTTYHQNIDLINCTKMSLATLPAEIRNHIFSLAVVQDQPLRATTFTKSFRTYAIPGPPPLARTCRQIRDEVLPIFYGRNTLHFDFTKVRFKMWLVAAVNRIPEVSKLLKSVILRRVTSSKGLYTQQYPYEVVELAICFNRKCDLRLSFLGPNAPMCTCGFEEMIWNAARADGLNASSSVFEFTLLAASSYASWTRWRPDEPIMRSASCQCGMDEGEGRGRTYAYSGA